MGNLYSGNIQVERLLKANLPAKDSGDKWYLVKADADSNVCEMYITDANGKVIPVADSTARQQINDCLKKVDRHAIDLNTLRNTGTQGYCINCTNTPNGVDGSLLDYKSHETTGYQEFVEWNTGKKYFRIYLVETWQPWIEFATTTKTAVLFLPKAGYTITHNNSCQINNIIFVSLTVKKTDSSVIAKGILINPVSAPTAQETALVGCALDGNSSVLSSVPSVIIGSDANVYVNNANDNAISIAISGVVAL